MNPTPRAERSASDLSGERYKAVATSTVDAVETSVSIAPLLRELAPHFCSQASAARYFGVSRMAVQELDKRYGLGLNRRQKNTWIEWPCPRCGKPVGLWTSLRSMERTGYCNSCSKIKSHCKRGHPLADGTGVAGTRRCKPCNNIRVKAAYARKRAEELRHG